MRSEITLPSMITSKRNNTSSLISWRQFKSCQWQNRGAWKQEAKLASLPSSWKMMERDRQSLFCYFHPHHCHVKPVRYNQDKETIHTQAFNTTKYHHHHTTIIIIIIIISSGESWIIYLVFCLAFPLSFS